MIRATLVLLAAHLVIPRLRRLSAAQRHLLWAASLVGAALLPLLGIVLPAWQPEWASRLAGTLPGTLTTFRPWRGGEGAEIVVRAIALEPATGPLGNLVALIWPIGTTVALLLLALEIVKLTRIVSFAEPVPHRWVEIADEIARTLGASGSTARRRAVRHRTSLRSSSRAVVAITWGIWRPQIVLPTCAAEWSEERLRAVLTHELAHVRRGDWLVHIHAELVCAVYWFHPLFWTTRNRLCRESEQAADDMVLGLGADGEDYAAHLLAIVRAARPPARLSSATMAMARASHLEARIASLVSARTNRRGVTAHLVIAAGLLTIVAALPLAAMSATGVGMDIRVRTENLPRIVGTAAASATADVAPVRGIRVSRETAGSTVIAPEIAEYTTPPLYSEEARRRRIEGLVTAVAHIGADGGASGVRIVRGLGAGLDQNALVALRQWRFRPGTRDRVTAAMDAEIDIEFSLRHEALNELIANDMATNVEPGVTPPRAIRVFRPARHSVATRGTVVLDVVLGEDGAPRVVRLLRSVSPELDESAVRTFEQWRFSPAMKDGRAVKVRMNAEVRFHG